MKNRSVAFLAIVMACVGFCRCKPDVPEIVDLETLEIILEQAIPSTVVRGLGCFTVNGAGLDKAKSPGGRC